MAITLAELPVEIIQHILVHISSDDACAVERTCWHFRGLISELPLLWMSYFKRRYRYSNSPGPNSTSTKSCPSSHQSRAAYARRRLADRNIVRLFEQITTSTKSRYLAIEKIAEQGLDAKDKLLEIIEDVNLLCDKFWANAILGRIHRSLGITAWISRSPPAKISRLTEVLTAFDIFVTEGEDGIDLGLVEQEMGRLQLALMERYQQILSDPLETRVARVADFFWSQGFGKWTEDDGFHNLRNNFIGLAILEKPHTALPLICTAIYCALAQSVGLDAAPCSFPYHVYATIVGGTLSDPSLVTLSMSEPNFGRYQSLEIPLYVDAFHPQQFPTKGQLELRLSEMGVVRDSYQTFLGPAQPVDMALRTSQNIIRNIRLRHRDESIQVPGPDSNMAFYAAMFASIVLQQSSTPGDDALLAIRRQRYWTYLSDHLQQYCPWDFGLVRAFIVPLFEDFPGELDILNVVDEIISTDKQEPSPSPRTMARLRNVRYYIGQMFRHKRYRYLAVIRGWHHQCQASDAWKTQMNIDALPRGGEQSFYQVLVDDGSHRYVAEDNIELTDEVPSRALSKLAGRYFKSFDAEAGKFISNIKEQYPDD